MPSCRSEPTPYLPTVKAMAPSTPSGARWMIRPMTLNSTSASASTTVATGWPRSPSSASAQPNSTANSSTCSTSPVAKALTARAGVDVHARARLEPKAQHQAQHQGDGGQQLEVDQRLHAHPAHAPEVARAGDAMHDHAEHQHRNDHLDQPDEAVTERLE